MSRRDTMVAMKDASERYRAWKGLLDFSTRFALAVMRAQGMSKARAWDVFCHRWRKASHEHQRSNLKILRNLYERDRAKRSA